MKILHPDDRERVLAENQRTIQTGEPFRMDYRILTKDGRVVWVRDEALLERDESGNPLHWRGIWLDITAQKEAENRLKLSEEKFAKAFLTSPDSVNINRLSDGLYIDINKGFTRIMGYQRQEVIGRSSLELKIWVNPEDRTRLVAELQARGFIDNFEAQFRTKDGRIRTGLMSARVIEICGEQCILSIARNITERKQRERELEAIVQVSAAMRQAFDQTQMINILAEQCCSLFESQNLLILLFSNDPAQARIAFAGGSWKIAEGQIVSLPGWLQKGESLSILSENEGSSQANWFNDLFGHLAEAEWVGWFPLKTSLADLGWLCLGLQRPLLQQETRILYAVLDIAASAIQRAILHEQTIQRLKQLNALHTIDRTINASLDIHFTANILLAQVAQQLKVNAATLLKFNELSQLFTVLATYQYPKHLIPAVYRLVNDPVRQAVLERKIIGVEDLPKFYGDKHFFQRSAGQGYSGYAAVPLISKGQVKGVLELFKHRALQFTEEWQQFLEALAAQTAIAIDNAEMFETLQRNQAQLSLAYEGVIEGFARALELRDPDTHGHSKLVAAITVRLARRFGFEEQALTHIRHGVLLHDIGNLAIPETILQKPDVLSEKEWQIIRMHPVYAMQILSNIPSLQPAAVIPYCHHERWDGTGYLRQLKGENIPLEARIFALVDVWDTLRSARPYRQAWQREQVLEYLRAQAGKQFDPTVVACLFRAGGHI